MYETVLSILVHYISINDLVALRCTSHYFIAMLENGNVRESLRCRYPTISASSFTLFVNEYDRTILDEIRSLHFNTDEWCAIEAAKDNSELGCRVMNKLMERDVNPTKCMKRALENKALLIVRHLENYFKDEMRNLTMIITSFQDEAYDKMHARTWRILESSLMTGDADIILFVHSLLRSTDELTGISVYSDILTEEETLNLLVGHAYAHSYLTDNWTGYNTAKEIYGPVHNDKLYVALYIDNEEFLTRMVQELKPSKEDIIRTSEREYVFWPEGIELALTLV